MSIQTAATAAVAAVCPIDGISFGVLTDKATWTVHYLAVATASERQAALDAIAAFDIAAATSQDARAQDAVDSKDRLLFEINFDQENRLRALEGQPAVTKAQYRSALITRWKQLNP